MAYGYNLPTGLQPFSYLGSSTNFNTTNSYPIASGYATSIFEGDPIVQLADGTIGTVTQAQIATASYEIPVLGTFRGCKYLSASGQYVYSKYWAANTVTMNAQNAEALILDDYNIIYAIQVSTSNSSVPATVNAVGAVQADFNTNAAFGVGACSFNPVTGPQGVYTPAINPGGGNTANGLSGFYLDYSEKGTTATLPLKIVRLSPVTAPANVLYVAGPPTVGVFNTVLVTLNNATNKGGTGTLGV